MLSSLPFKFIFFFIIFFGTLFSISSQHWLALWGGLELNIIGFLPILVYQKSSWERESAVKYFIVQALGSRLLIIGRLLSFSYTHSWEIINWLNQEYITIFIIMMGLILKLGVFPFHLWVPSVMSGLPWRSCMLLATWQKIAPLLLMFSLLICIRDNNVILIIVLIRGLSAIIGGVGGINQTQIRALIAYSSIGHIGWLSVRILGGLSAFYTYFIIYLLISLCLFRSLWQNELKFQMSLTNLKGISISKARVIICLLRLAGLPPMLGFTSKFIVIISTTHFDLWGGLFLLIGGSLIRLYYYLVLLFRTFSVKLDFIYKEVNYINFNILNVGIFVNLLGGLIILSLLIIM